MLSLTRQLIYIHVPKTGGNSIQELLLPLSDDHKVAGAHRDGMNRYEVYGPITPHKHASLSEYQERIGDLSGFFVAISVREPLQRAISFYFSPHRWARQREDQTWFISEPRWSTQEFVACLRHVKPMVEFVRLNGVIRRPTYIIRYESLAVDFAELVARQALPVSTNLRQTNKSAATPDLLSLALHDQEACRAVREKFDEDFRFFGYY